MIITITEERIFLKLHFPPYSSASLQQREGFVFVLKHQNVHKSQNKGESLMLHIYDYFSFLPMSKQDFQTQHIYYCRSSFPQRFFICRKTPFHMMYSMSESKRSKTGDEWWRWEIANNHHAAAAAGISARTWAGIWSTLSLVCMCSDVWQWGAKTNTHTDTDTHTFTSASGHEHMHRAGVIHYIQRLPVFILID